MFQRKSAYHHGEVSLIISPLFNLVQGILGEKIQQVQDISLQIYQKSLGRYLSRKMIMFVNYLEDDGDRVEPEWYMPII